MAQTLQSFAAKASEILKAENNAKGRSKVGVLLQEGNSFRKDVFRNQNIWTHW